MSGDGPTYYTTEAILLALVPKVTAFISIFSSLLILRGVLRDPSKRSKLYHRIMLGLATVDIVTSSVYFVGTWVIPRGTVGGYGPVFMAWGTRRTCALGGFFTQFAVCSPLYNATFCLYYLLLIRFRWRDDRLKKIEVFIHGCPILFSLGTASAAAALHLYGNVDWLCWIKPDPTPPYVWKYQWAFMFGPLWICITWVTFVMVVLWRAVRGAECANDVYRESAGERASRKRSQMVATQGMLYVVAFYITWFFPTLQRIIELTSHTNYFTLQFFDTALLPLQGLFNVIIYLRPRFLQRRKQYPDISFWAVVRMAAELSSTLESPTGGNSRRTFASPRPRRTESVSAYGLRMSSSPVSQWSIIQRLSSVVSGRTTGERGETAMAADVVAQAFNFDDDDGSINESIPEMGKEFQSDKSSRQFSVSTTKGATGFETTEEFE